MSAAVGTLVSPTIDSTVPTTNGLLGVDVEPLRSALVRIQDPLDRARCAEHAIEALRRARNEALRAADARRRADGWGVDPAGLARATGVRVSEVTLALSGAPSGR